MARAPGASSAAFVQVVEVWEPEGDTLRLRSGAYGRHVDFAQASALTKFRRGEGLPGTVWRSGRPEVWPDLGTSRFLRRDAARSAGLDAGLGFPVYQGEKLVSVVVFLCGSRAKTGGCIEVWEPSRRGDLAHAEGYYGRLGAFEIASRIARFGRGEGLPGLTWDRGEPQIFADVTSSAAFLRTEAARSCGLETGLGIPIHRGTVVEHVLIFLSAPETPVARAFEIWVPDAGGRLWLDQCSYSAGLDDFARSSRTTCYGRGEGLVGGAFARARPLADGTLATDAVRRASAERAGIGSGIAIPVHDGRRVTAVVVLLS